MAKAKGNTAGEEIERAQRLLNSGAITPAEYQRLKDAALAPGWAGTPTQIVYKKERAGCGSVILGLIIVTVVIGAIFGGKGTQTSSTASGTDSSGWNQDHQMMAIKSKRVLSRRLKDPDSVKYQDVFSNAANTCGTYNAKNSFGGYGEWQPFLGIGPGEPVVLIYGDKKFKSEWKARCSSLTGFSRID